MIRLVSNVFWMRPWDILSLTRATHFAQTRLCLCVVFVLLSRCECECESIWVTRWQTRHDACDMWEDLSNLLDCACVYRDSVVLFSPTHVMCVASSLPHRCVSILFVLWYWRIILSSPIVRIGIAKTLRLLLLEWFCTRLHFFLHRLEGAATYKLSGTHVFCVGFNVAIF